MIDKTTIFRKSSKLYIEHSGDYATLIPKIDGLVSTVNEVGRVIYELIDGNKSCDEISSIISLKYKMNYEVVFDDVMFYCKELLEAGHIE